MISDLFGGSGGVECLWFTQRMYRSPAFLSAQRILRESGNRANSCF